MEIKKLAGLSLIALTLAACQTSNLKGKAHTGFTKYSKEKNHKAFFVFETPDNGFVYGYTYNRGTRMAAYNAASIKCNKLFDQVNFSGKCRPYAIDDIKVASMTKEEIHKLLQIAPPPKKHASPATRPPAPTIQSFEVYGTWENVSENVTGTFQSNPEDPKNSTLDISFNGINCSGHAKYARGAYKAKIPPEGVWSVSCDKGMTATGTYRSFEPGTGIAKGTDNKGHKIDLMYKPKD
ncbi:hypothetical protein [Terasakiella pusilla]|uniref:hypothetical protein n=1 Tax=Terasakiella pusilla TaxID=64973 RepID=UPI003AA98463